MGKPSAPSYRYLPLHPPELTARLVDLHRERADLQEAYPVMDSPGYARWAHVDAFLAFEDFPAYFLPLPPDERMNVVSSGGAGGFLSAGFAAFMVLDRVLENQGRRFSDAGRVLDFGCGCGRILRHWQDFAGDVELHGCDVDAEAVRWVQEHIDFVEARVSSIEPPLPYDVDSFDLLYGNSIFSHLEEWNHLRWIAELHRVVTAGGTLVLTTHGPGALELLEKTPERVSTVGLVPKQIAQARRDLDARGYAFCTQPGVVNPDVYGMTFMTPEYVRDRWSVWFEVEAHESRALDDWQDVVVLRAR